MAKTPRVDLALVMPKRPTYTLIVLNLIAFSVTMVCGMIAALIGNYWLVGLLILVLCLQGAQIGIGAGGRKFVNLIPG